MILSMGYTGFDITTIMSKMISKMRGCTICHLWPFIIEYHHLLMIGACLGLLAIGASCLFVSQSMHHCLFNDRCISWSLGWSVHFVISCTAIGASLWIGASHSHPLRLGALWLGAELTFVAWCRVVLCSLVQSGPLWLGAELSFTAWCRVVLRGLVQSRPSQLHYDR